MKKLCSILLAVALTMGLICIPAQAASVTISPWAEELVNTAQKAGLVPDSLPSNYTAPITRAQFCRLAVQLYETATGQEISGRTSFQDTSDEAVAKMAYLGVVSGVGEGRFNPDGLLTREQAAAILVKLSAALGTSLAESDATFGDMSMVDAWAKSAVGKVQAAGIMSGDENGKFLPYGSYTIEQSVITILRAKQAAEGSTSGKQDAVTTQTPATSTTQQTTTAQQTTTTKPTTTTQQTGALTETVSGTFKGISWSLDTSGTLTFSGSGEIPYVTQSKIPWYPYASQVKRIVVEEGITKLKSAFSGYTSLTSVSLPESVTTLGGNLFRGCSSLTEVTIPAGVTEIEHDVFTLCPALTAINVEKGNTTFKSIDGVLFSKDGTKLLQYPEGKPDTDYRIPDGVVLVDTSLRNAYLTALTVPTSMVYHYTLYAFGKGLSLMDCDNLTQITCLGNEVQAYALTASEAVSQDRDNCTLYIRPFWSQRDIAVRYQPSEKGIYNYTISSASQADQIIDDLLQCEWPIALLIHTPEGQGEAIYYEIMDQVTAIHAGNNSYYAVNIVSVPNLNDLIICSLEYQDYMDIMPYSTGNLDVLSDSSVELYQKCQQIIQQIITPGMTEYEKVRAIHDYIVNNTVYTYTGENVHSPKGPLLDGESVCEGYAEAFQILCTMCDIDTIFVVGNVTSSSQPHAWNKVRVDGVWYNMDVTWDDPSGTQVLRYNYFLISDDKLGKDHYGWDTTNLPACPSNYADTHTVDYDNTTGKLNSTTSNKNNTSNSNSNSSSSSSNKNNSSSNKNDQTNIPVTYLGTFVDQYGFTWVEVISGIWNLRIGGEVVDSVIESPEAETAGYSSLNDYINAQRPTYPSLYTPDQQTAEDVAPQPY